MNRREMLATVGVASVSTLESWAAEPSSREADPWIGTYLKYAKYDTERTGSAGEVRTIAITKDRDGYSLSKPYAHARFREEKKGVLSDGKGGLGRIYLGSAEYADGKKVSILRVEFCYEDFVLYRDAASESANSSETAGRDTK